MRYADARKLHCGDEITIKETNTQAMVIYVIDRKGRKEAVIMCDDGYEYTHQEIK
jgi:hypothetical protein